MTEATKTTVEAEVKPNIEDDPWYLVKLNSTYCCAVIGCVNPGIFLLEIDMAVQGLALCMDCHLKYDWDVAGGKLVEKKHSTCMPYSREQAVNILKEKYGPGYKGPPKKKK